MRLLRRVVVPTGLSCLLLWVSPRVGALQTAPSEPQVQTPQPGTVAHPPEMFGGLWDYNAEESVNAATGRPEQSPRSATQPGGGGQRSGGGTTRLPLPRGGGGPTNDGWGTAAGSGRVGVGGGGGYAPPPALLRENRDLQRDLLEVPEALTIRVAPNRVTFVDDLDRERTYPTDGSRHRYQLAASRFNAKLVWTSGQLRKEIDGGFGFKMTETYFLSSDGQRLFVILRVEKSRPDGPTVGANRVYDRVAVD
jgi:hypothetical protein